MRRFARFLFSAPALLALLAVTVVGSAVLANYEGQYGWDEVDRVKKEILEKIPTDPEVLINVTLDVMPGTPELTALGRKATAALSRGLLDNASDPVRALCAGALSEIRDPDSAPALVEALGDRSVAVKLAAVQGLGNLANPKYGEPILKLVDDPEEDYSVKSSAIAAVGNLGYQKAIPRLEAAVRNKNDGSLSWDALQSLWHMRNRADRGDLVDIFLYVLKENGSGATLAVDYLGALKADEAAGTLASYFVGKDAETKNRIILAMEKIGNGAALDFLRKVVKTSQEARHLNNAAIALYRLGKQKEVVDLLLALLKDRKAYMRINAAFALGEVGEGSDKAVTGLVSALEDQNDYVRSEAAVALGRIKATAAQNALLELSKSDNPFVQLDAVIALNRIDFKTHRQLIFDKLLVHKDPKFARIVERGIRFLAEQGDPEAIPHLLSYMRSQYSTSYGDAIRLLKAYDPAKLKEFEPSLNYMAHTCGYECLPDLLRTLRTWKLPAYATALLERLYRAYYSGDRTLLYFTIGKIAAPELSASIAKIREWDNTSNLYRLFALANLGDRKALDDLVAELVGGTLDVKRDTGFLLGALDTKDAAPRLEELMKSGDPFTAVAAASALLAQGNKQAYEFLYKTMSEGTPIVADEAERALLISETPDLDVLLKDSARKEKNVVTGRRLNEILYRRAPKEFR